MCSRLVVVVGVVLCRLSCVVRFDVCMSDRKWCFELGDFV